MLIIWDIMQLVLIQALMQCLGAASSAHKNITQSLFHGAEWRYTLPQNGTSAKGIVTAHQIPPWVVFDPISASLSAQVPIQDNFRDGKSLVWLKVQDRFNVTDIFIHLNVSRLPEQKLSILESILRSANLSSLESSSVSSFSPPPLIVQNGLILNAAYYQWTLHRLTIKLDDNHSFNVSLTAADTLPKWLEFDREMKRVSLSTNNASSIQSLKTSDFIKVSLKAIVAAYNLSSTLDLSIPVVQLPRDVKVSTQSVRLNMTDWNGNFEEVSINYKSRPGKLFKIIYQDQSTFGGLKIKDSSEKISGFVLDPSRSFKSSVLLVEENGSKSLDKHYILLQMLYEQDRRTLFNGIKYLKANSVNMWSNITLIQQQVVTPLPFWVAADQVSILTAAGEPLPSWITCGLLSLSSTNRTSSVICKALPNKSSLSFGAKLITKFGNRDFVKRFDVIVNRHAPPQITVKTNDNYQVNAQVSQFFVYPLERVNLFKQQDLLVYRVSGLKSSWLVYDAANNSLYGYPSENSTSYFTVQVWNTFGGYNSVPVQVNALNLQRSIDNRPDKGLQETSTPMANWKIALIAVSSILLLVIIAFMILYFIFKQKRSQSSLWSTFRRGKKQDSVFLSSSDGDEFRGKAVDVDGQQTIGANSSFDCLDAVLIHQNLAANRQSRGSSIVDLPCSTMPSTSTLMSEHSNELRVMAFCGKAFYYEFPYELLLKKSPSYQGNSGKHGCGLPYRSSSDSDYQTPIPSSDFLPETTSNWHNDPYSSYKRYKLYGSIVDNSSFSDEVFSELSARQANKKRSQQADSFKTGRSQVTNVSSHARSSDPSISSSSSDHHHTRHSLTEPIHKALMRFTARMADGRALPDWLHFNRSKCSFFGVPSEIDCGSLLIEVISWKIDNVFEEIDISFDYSLIKDYESATLLLQVYKDDTQTYSQF
ncbi:hypothetical protein MP228_004890 [Amoeboaphelidium protococcarum]|nr:hypothetical protein MP228_004890 [Amoeboaphelidium protococcarum]